MEADKNEFNIYRQPCLSDIITMPPSATNMRQPTVLQNTPHSSHRNTSATTEAKQEFGPITITAVCYIE
jgi:hypothetical protein